VALRPAARGLRASGNIGPTKGNNQRSKTRDRVKRDVTIELINTGTELLLGNVVNTHLSWLGQQLFPLGLRLRRQATVPDGSAIRDALLEAMSRQTEVVLITGGLGPTGDDLTREICAELLGLPLEHNEEILEQIRERLGRRGIALRDNMKKQALVPRGAVVLPNRHGTAPGLYLSAPAGDKSLHFFLLPGPPRELHPMFLDEVLPRLRELIAGRVEPRKMRIYRVIGMGESAVEETIGTAIEKEGRVEVGYCARPNEVDFRLIGQAEDLDAWQDRVLAALGPNFAGLGEEPLEATVVRLLRERGAQLATAESCTGGLLAHRLTNVPGASEVFWEGLVVYANEAKMTRLGVPAEIIEQHGAVSAPTARAMVAGLLQRPMIDFALSTTGLAGPGGGTPHKPVGTVFFGLGVRGHAPVAWQACYPMDRASFKQTASQTALDALRRFLQHGTWPATAE
jgi:nicotinamide-nucleotide amidase